LHLLLPPGRDTLGGFSITSLGTTTSITPQTANTGASPPACPVGHEHLPLCSRSTWGHQEPSGEGSAAPCPSVGPSREVAGVGHGPVSTHAPPTSRVKLRGAEDSAFLAASETPMLWTCLLEISNLNLPGFENPEVCCFATTGTVGPLFSSSTSSRRSERRCCTERLRQALAHIQSLGAARGAEPLSSLSLPRSSEPPAQAAAPGQCHFHTTPGVIQPPPHVLQGRRRKQTQILCSLNHFKISQQQQFPKGTGQFQNKLFFLLFLFRC